VGGGADVGSSGRDRPGVAGQANVGALLGIGGLLTFGGNFGVGGIVVERLGGSDETVGRFLSQSLVCRN
jgi:hypothetical protein